MEYNEFISLLADLHNVLNDGLFNGELNKAFVASFDHPTCDITKIVFIAIIRSWAEEDYDYYAHFKYSGIETIAFEDGYLKYRLPTLKGYERIYDLSRVMLHEMIHQYIHEKGIIDSSPHGKEFRRCCKRFGLWKFRVNGILVDDLSPEAKRVVEESSLMKKLETLENLENVVIHES